MFDRVRALDLIERAFETDPFCHACAAPTTIVDEDGVLYLECQRRSESHGFVGRLSAAFLPHLRRQVVDLSEGIAA